MLKKILAVIVGCVLALAFASAMSISSPAVAHKGGPEHGNTYGKNYYPAGYFSYCQPDGSHYYGKTKAAQRCERGYTGYAKQWKNGRAYYRVAVIYRWQGPESSEWHGATPQYYCQLHKYDDPDSKAPRFKCQVTNKSTGKRYWQRFDRYVPPKPPPPDTTPPETWITSGDRYSVRAGTTITHHFRFSEDVAFSHYECRHWGYGRDATYDEAMGKGVPWHTCRTTYSYQVGNEYHQTFEVRAVDEAGNADPVPAVDYFEAYSW